MIRINLIIITLFINLVVNACEFPDVSFTDDFSSAHLDRCQQVSTNRYLLTIKPENNPINNSPWYAFKVKGNNKQTIYISIEYIHGTHRYPPKTSYDGKVWLNIPYRVRNKKLTFKLKIDKKPLTVAAQELITNELYLKWLKTVVKKQSKFKLSELGQSTQSRPIYQLEHNTSSNEWVVILGRQHPPEVTGALALFPFSQQLLFNKKLGNAFRKRFNILIIPNLNPDGVEHGYWRSNINEVDLNRDWKKFSQKETRLVRDRLNQIVFDGGKIVFAIDFHSTSHDVFYTMPSDNRYVPALLTENWLNSLDNLTPEFKVVMKPKSSRKAGVFKQYIADEFGVHAVTYEMGDNTERKQIRTIAYIAGVTFMQEILKMPKESFNIIAATP